MPGNANTNKHSDLVAKALAELDAPRLKNTSTKGFGDELFAHGIVSISRFAKKAPIIAAIAIDQRKAFIITYNNRRVPVFAAVPESIATTPDSAVVIKSSPYDNDLRDILNLSLPEPLVTERMSRNYQWNGQYLSPRRIDSLTQQAGDFIKAAHDLKLKFSNNTALIITRVVPALPEPGLTATNLGTPTP